MQIYFSVLSKLVPWFPLIAIFLILFSMPFCFEPSSTRIKLGKLTILDRNFFKLIGLVLCVMFGLAISYDSLINDHQVRTLVSISAPFKANKGDVQGDNANFRLIPRLVAGASDQVPLTYDGNLHKLDKIPKRYFEKSF